MVFRLSGHLGSSIGASRHLGSDCMYCNMASECNSVGRNGFVYSSDWISSPQRHITGEGGKKKTIFARIVAVTASPV